MSILATISVKKIVAAFLNLPLNYIVILRTSGWIQGVDAPAFTNGYQNTPNPEAFDVGFNEAPSRFQVTLAIKIGPTIGQTFVVEFEKSQVEELLAAAPGGYDL
jgi:hypothetical protein